MYVGFEDFQSFLRTTCTSIYLFISLRDCQTAIDVQWRPLLTDPGRTLNS